MEQFLSLGIDASPALVPAVGVISHAGNDYGRGWLKAFDQAADDRLGKAGRIGLIARNRPHHVALLGWSLSRRRDLAMMYAQAPDSLALQVQALGLDALCLDAEDVSPALLAAFEERQIAVFALGDGRDMITKLGNGAVAGGAAQAQRGGISVMSSGTTGMPKHIDLPWPMIDAMVRTAGDSYAGSANRSAPQILVHPLGSIGGIAYVAPALASGQNLVLMEKFEPRAWADAVECYRPQRASIPPAGVRMLIEAAIAPSKLASLSLLAIGGGKLDAGIRARFEVLFSIPVLTAYGATEFGGVIAAWTLEDYRRLGSAKRESAGRAVAGADIRIVDDAGEPLPPGVVGLLEARSPRTGPDWIRSTDFASLDDDGFLYIHGRADGAINRGGFKIVPDSLAAEIAAHPAVADAAVVGRLDDRLGEVPVAAVELAAGTSASAAEIAAWLRGRVPAYQMPVDIRIFTRLPRNGAMKISLTEVQILMDAP